MTISPRCPQMAADMSAELLHGMALGHSLFLERVLDPAPDPETEELALRDVLLELLLALVDRWEATVVR